jgi:hypothetical protein
MNEQSIKERLTSRKFWAFLAAVVVIIGTAVTGQTEWSNAINDLLIAVGTYIAGNTVETISRNYTTAKMMVWLPDDPIKD